LRASEPGTRDCNRSEPPSQWISLKLQGPLVHRPGGRRPQHDQRPSTSCPQHLRGRERPRPRGKAVGPLVPLLVLKWWRCPESNRGPRSSPTDIYGRVRVTRSRAPSSHPAELACAPVDGLSPPLSTSDGAARRLHDTGSRHVGAMAGRHRYLLGSERERRLGSCGLALFSEFEPNSARSPEAALSVEACHPQTPLRYALMVPWSRPQLDIRRPPTAGAAAPLLRITGGARGAPARAPSHAGRRACGCPRAGRTASCRAPSPAPTWRARR
jgi:hypothetical protein